MSSISSTDEDIASIEGSTELQDESRPVDEEIDVKADPPPDKGKSIVHRKSSKKMSETGKNDDSDDKSSFSKKNLPQKGKSSEDFVGGHDEPNKSHSTRSKEGKGKSSKYSSKLTKGLSNVKVEPPLQETASSNSGLSSTSGFSDVVQHGKFLGKMKKTVDANSKFTVQILKPKRNMMFSQSTMTNPSNLEPENQPTSSKQITKEKIYLKGSTMKPNKVVPPELKNQADKLWTLSKEDKSHVLIQTPPLFGEDDQALNKNSQTEELSKILSCCQIELMCGICHELFVEPAMLLCGHSYCANCIHNHMETSVKQKAECPICCEVISMEPSRNTVLANLIASLHSHWDKKLVKNRNELVKERKEEVAGSSKTTTGIPVQEEAIFFYRSRGELVQADLQFNNGHVHTFKNDHELTIFKQALDGSDHRDDHYWSPDE